MMTDAVDPSVLATARRWLTAEPDDDLRDELGALIERAEAGDGAELAERFAGSLRFGTAGLRAAVGAGSMRMNRLVVRQAAAGLGRWLLEQGNGAAERGVTIAYDARRKSDHFAHDTARVLAAMGIKAMIHPGVQPTPVLAWSITGLGAAAGVVVTASHNPPADNGYKVYLETGAQIVAPVDAEIARLIAGFDPVEVELAAPDHPLVRYLDHSWEEAYVAAAPAVRRCPDVPGVPVAYTAMHGVGGETLLRAFEAAGLPAPAIVAEQFVPDGSFPTVAFPNPEEPGAMDRVIEVAEDAGVDVALANDPDADRLGVAIRRTDGGWRLLSGDEIGWLLADHILANSEGDDRLVVTTLVSSSLLSRMAEAHGVHSAETFTGFKWMAKLVTERPDLRFVFGYEQALGYLVTDRPLDKDGITAAVLFAEVAAVAAADGITVEDRLDAIAERYGRYVTAETAVRIPPVAGAAWVAELEASPPTTVAGRTVESVVGYPEANLVRMMLAGGMRVQVRPSGTEPKVKLYGEAVDLEPDELRRALDAVAALAPAGSS